MFLWESKRLAASRSSRMLDLDGESLVAENTTSLRPDPSSIGVVAWLRDPAIASLHRSIVTAYGPEPGRSIHDQDDSCGRSENVGLSKANIGENLMPRKPKAPPQGSSTEGESGLKINPKDLVDGQLVQVHKKGVDKIPRANVRVPVTKVTNAILLGKSSKAFNKALSLREKGCLLIKGRSDQVGATVYQNTGEQSTESLVKGCLNLKCSEIPCRLSSYLHERLNDLCTISERGSVKIDMSVKMRNTSTSTERPYEASLYTAHREQLMKRDKKLARLKGEESKLARPKGERYSSPVKGVINLKAKGLKPEPSRQIALQGITPQTVQLRRIAFCLLLYRVMALGSWTAVFPISHALGSGTAVFPEGFPSLLL
ncbi:hypothetical protein Tco_0604643 [Tanacetum coccineum]